MSPTPTFVNLENGDLNGIPFSRNGIPFSFIVLWGGQNDPYLIPTDLIKHQDLERKKNKHMVIW